MSYKDSKQLVLGDGPTPAKVMIIGEAPGAKEVEEHKPFIGKSGKTLNKWLEYVGLPREKVYITNVVKEKLEKNRAPFTSEIWEYTPMLMSEITKVDPQLIITLGKTPLSILLPQFEKLEDALGVVNISKVQGKSRTVLALYHPSYINRMGHSKEPELYEALDNIKDLLENIDV